MDRAEEKSNGSKSPTRNGAKSPTRNGDLKRPDYDRTDTAASGWATENEDEKVQ